MSKNIHKEDQEKHDTTEMIRTIMLSLTQHQKMEVPKHKGFFIKVIQNTKHNEFVCELTHNKIDNFKEVYVDKSLLKIAKNLLTKLKK